MLKEKFAKFMYGRYGNDKFNIALLVLFFVLWFVNLFVSSKIIYVLTLLIIVYQLFRTFSRNTFKRQRENIAFLKIWNKIWPKIKLFFKRIKDITKFRYRTCPSCKAVLRLPRKRGTHSTRCPKCGNSFDVKIHF
ncbi:MAG: hypothetical protein RRY76_01050 [Clostridia bacterium]